MFFPEFVIFQTSSILSSLSKMMIVYHNLVKMAGLALIWRMVTTVLVLLGTQDEIAALVRISS